MSPRARRGLLALLLSSLVVLVVFALGQPKAARSHLVGWVGVGPFSPLFDMRPAARRLYVDPDWDAATVRELEVALAGASQRVERLFGSRPRARPVVIAADSPERIRRFMGNLHGATHTTPLATIVVLGPEGRASIDVIAHELVHAEHAERAGWLRYTFAPMWFIEGLGMQVDHRPEYDDEAWLKRTDEGALAPALEELALGRDFARGDLTANYAHARREVSRWLDSAGPGALDELLASWSWNWSWDPRERYRASF